MTTTDHDWSRGSQERLIPTQLGAINVRVGGRLDGPTMVFWPSLLMNGSMWRHQYEHYAPTHRVVLVDAPGIGKSAPLTRTITMLECSDCLVSILDGLDIDTCVLLGNSWGAILACVFAAWHPERLDGVIAANGTASGTTLFDRVQLTPLIALLGLHTRTPRWWMKVARSNFAGKTAGKAKPAFLASFRCVLDENPRSMALQMKSILLNREDTHATLRTIAGVPVLIIAGDEDRVFSVATEQEVARSIPGSSLVVLPETGHLSALESPQLFNAAVDGFLRLMPLPRRRRPAR
jgi:3-oxoadipate enol-lactonase